MNMEIDRRTVMAGIGAAAAATLMADRALAAGPRAFPTGFRWGAATAAYQVEGNNIASDLWLLEHVKPTMFAEPSGDAINSFELWQTDLDLVRQLHLNTYRFSLEWARIEPEEGAFSTAMMDHYARIMDGCLARGIAPMVTFSHFSLPAWFAADGGWTNPHAADRFARYCDRAARRLAAGMRYATTLNEPNMGAVVGQILPPGAGKLIAQMNAAAATARGVPRFRNGMLPELADIPVQQQHMIAAHKAGRAAIKAVRPDLPVGVSLTVADDQAVGADSIRDQRRAIYYRDWLEAARGDDFIGVQNYARAQWTAEGSLPAPHGMPVSEMDTEIYPPSLGNAVRYIHEASGLPVMVTEHGLATRDDTLRARFIPAALSGLLDAIRSGVPVLGYVHWTLVDNWEWVFGFGKHYGLCSVDRATFRRTPKPSAAVLAQIAAHNRVSM